MAGESTLTPEQQALEQNAKAFQQGHHNFLSQSQVADGNMTKQAPALQQNATRTAFGPYLLALGKGQHKNGKFLSGFSINKSSTINPSTKQAEAQGDLFPLILDSVNGTNSPFWKIPEHKKSEGPANAYGYYWNMEYPPSSVDAIVNMQNQAKQQGTLTNPEYVVRF